MNKCVIMNVLDEETGYMMCIAQTYRDRDDIQSYLLKLLIVASRKVILSLIDC